MNERARHVADGPARAQRGMHAELLDAAAAADRLGVSVQTLRTWARRGWIPLHRAGRKSRFNPAEVDRAMRDRACGCGTELRHGS